jgi:hypothetical protein
MKIVDEDLYSICQISLSFFCSMAFHKITLSLMINDYNNGTFCLGVWHNSG